MTAYAERLSFCPARHYLNRRHGRDVSLGVIERRREYVSHIRMVRLARVMFLAQHDGKAPAYQLSGCRSVYPLTRSPR